MMLNYRSFNDLNACIRRNLAAIPRDTDLIVGIPRSGLLAANLLALHLNVALTDLDGLLADKLFPSGRTRGQRHPNPSAARHILVVDDSLHSGGTIARAQKALAGTAYANRTSYLTVYGTERALDHVDICLEVCPLPRVFEWNLLHHPFLERACVRLEGILLPASTGHAGPDQPGSLSDRVPLAVPTRTIRVIVTSRPPEQERELVRWLLDCGIRFLHLAFDGGSRLGAGDADAISTRAARTAGIAASKDCMMIIEDDPEMAAAVAARGSVAVICTGDQRSYNAAAAKDAKPPLSRLVIKASNKKMALLRSLQLRF